MVVVAIVVVVKVVVVVVVEVVVPPAQRLSGLVSFFEDNIRKLRIHPSGMDLSILPTPLPGTPGPRCAESLDMHFPFKMPPEAPSQRSSWFERYLSSFRQRFGTEI